MKSREPLVPGLLTYAEGNTQLGDRVPALMNEADEFLTL
jgi:hypothetical protein